MTSSTGKTSQLSDDTAVLGIALAATIGISASEGAWEVLETVMGAILVLILLTYVDLKDLRRSSSVRRKLVFSGVMALCVSLAGSWPLQSFVFKVGDLNVNNSEKIREFDDKSLTGLFGLAFIVTLVWLRSRPAQPRALPNQSADGAAQGVGESPE
jgi:hypothetical protein